MSLYTWPPSHPPPPARHWDCVSQSLSPSYPLILGSAQPFASVFSMLFQAFPPGFLPPCFLATGFCGSLCLQAQPPGEWPLGKGRATCWSAAPTPGEDAFSCSGRLRVRRGLLFPLACPATSSKSFLMHSCGTIVTMKCGPILTHTSVGPSSHTRVGPF